MISSGTGKGDCNKYTTRSFQRLVNDASASENTTEPTYTTRSYQKLAAPATTESNSVPAKYESRTYQTLANDAAASEATTPATYTNRSFQKLANDATTTSNSIEAQYETRTYRRTAPATTTSTEIPAEYKTVSKRQLVTPGGTTEWREVVCDSDITPDLYRRVQSALIERGYNVGSAGADGRIGAATKAALVKFQRDNGLPVGQLDFETLRALGVR